MSTEALIRRFHDLPRVDPEATVDADSLIGVFQLFRPDGAAAVGLYDEIDVGQALQSRLAQLYAAAGDDRRPQGGRDAYFVIRRPPPIDPERVEELGEHWLQGLSALAAALGDTETVAALTPLPSIRVLEGHPPKHPREASEKSQLLRRVQEHVSRLVDQVDAGPYAPLLRPAYYFTACDAMLRDYLMWPLYAAATGLQDPLAAYFELWRHGIKYRIFRETQVDLYIPRKHG